MGTRKDKMCPRCFGTQKNTCHVCLKMKLSDTDREKARTQFLGELHTKAQKYDMNTFGSPQVNKVVKDEYGSWKRDGLDFEVVIWIIRFNHLMVKIRKRFNNYDDASKYLNANCITDNHVGGAIFENEAYKYGYGQYERQYPKWE